jgi:endonuclease/exonuclease/phosphatase family metal-dependent hydrolase
MLGVAVVPISASAQLRIVTMNAANSGASTAGPRTGMSTILSAIGSSVSDDPTLAGSTGIAKPIDVLCLQEANSAATTAQEYAALCNSIYGTSAYSWGTLDGNSTGSGTQAIVFNASAVQLVSSATVGTASTTGQPRQTLRYQLRPAGYGSAADVWIYNGHYKASDDATSANRRNIEAQAIRADVAAHVPSGANVIYLGDMNVYTSSEAMYQTLLSASVGQAFDPINKPGAWHGSGTFLNIHTQSPFDANIGSSGFTGGGMDDRFDQQLVTANVMDGHGVAYIGNSYEAFGNNGSHALNQPINSGTGASPAVLNAEASILDHLPVVADYQLPARMSVLGGSPPTAVIVGGSATFSVSISNSAPVSFANGADKLVYTVTSAGSISGGGSGTLAALAPATIHVLTMNTSAPGISSGSWTASSSSEAAANAGPLGKAATTTVLAHANASFSSSGDVNAATIDFGIYAEGSGTQTQGFSIVNLNSVPGFTARLDLDSISDTGATSTLATNFVPRPGIAAGGSATFSASLNTAATGSFAAAYTIASSDENLPGASSGSPVTLNLRARIALGGDANLDNVVDTLDFNALAAHFGQTGAAWQTGDFNRDGAVDTLDFNSLAANFGQTSAADSGNVVPEPNAILLVILASVEMAIRRR